jgi:hypothetical protein
MLTAVIVVACALLFFVSSYLVNKKIPNRCNGACNECPLKDAELKEEK